MSLFAEYVAHGWLIVPFDKGTKGPLREGWNLRHNAVSDPDIARWLDGNAGLLHAYSGTCCIDVDDAPRAITWCEARGIDLNALREAADAVLILSGRPNRFKLLYDLPTPLPSFRLPGIELRCATRKGTSVQDVLPPSIHPDTQKPYEWHYGDIVVGHWSCLPTLPEPLAAVWRSLVTPETKIIKEEPRAALVPTNLGTLRTMLYRHDPDASYDDWIAAGMAIHHETGGDYAGLMLWDEWSKRGTKYKNQADLANHWRSFSDVPNARTAASLRVDEPALVDEFDEVTEDDVKRAVLAVGDAALPKRMDGQATDEELAREVSRQLQRDSTGKPWAALGNVHRILLEPRVHGSHLAFDTFRCEMMCAPVGTEEWRALRDTDYTFMRMWLEQTANFRPVSKDLVRDVIHLIGEENQMDTAQKWLNGLEWDGRLRIENFLPYYWGTIDAAYERAVGVYLWTALAGRIMDPGCQVDMVPILIGAQGIGKSQGVKALVPDPQFFTEIRLDEPDDTIARKMRGVMVGEIAELRGLRNSDLERIKAFVTRTHEKWTPKFMEYSTTFARRLVMIGTTNDDDCLPEDEENRRWLPVRCAQIDVEGIIRDREQLWAEALEHWKHNGVQWRMAQSLGKTKHVDFKAPHAWDSVIRQWLREQPNGAEVRLHDVLVNAVGLDIRTITRVQEVRCGRLLRAMGYIKTSVRRGGKPIKVWQLRGVFGPHAAVSHAAASQEDNDPLA